tara:strand:- start:257 stop:472 length:216 start_codon:yes stop_codon:yes gene_type:complete
MERVIVKQRKSLTKHDLRRKIEDIEKAVYFISERLRRFEVVFNDYIEMQENVDKFKEFLDGKHKQPEHKQS